MSTGTRTPAYPSALTPPNTVGSAFPVSGMQTRSSDAPPLTAGVSHVPTEAKPGNLVPSGPAAEYRGERYTGSQRRGAWTWGSRGAEPSRISELSTPLNKLSFNVNDDLTRSEESDVDSDSEVQFRHRIKTVKPSAGRGRDALAWVSIQPIAKHGQNYQGTEERHGVHGKGNVVHDKSELNRFTMNDAHSKDFVGTQIREPNRRKIDRTDKKPASNADVRKHQRRVRSHSREKSDDQSGTETRRRDDGRQNRQRSHFDTPYTSRYAVSVSSDDEGVKERVCKQSKDDRRFQRNPTNERRMVSSSDSEGHVDRTAKKRSEIRQYPTENRRAVRQTSRRSRDLSSSDDDAASRCGRRLQRLVKVVRSDRESRPRRQQTTAVRFRDEQSDVVSSDDENGKPTVYRRGNTYRNKLRTVMKVGKFDGSSSIDTFLIQFEPCANYNGWSNQEKAANLKCCLSGTAGQILWESGDPNNLTYAELASKLKAWYGATGQRELFSAQLRARRRRPNETLSELYRDIRRLMALSYPNTSGSELQEEIAKSHFISALGDRNLELKVREREPKDLDAAFTIAVQMEAYQNAYVSGESTESRSSKNSEQDNLSGRIAAIERTLKEAEPIDSQVDELRRQLESERAERVKISRELGRFKLLDEQRRAGEATVVADPRQEGSFVTRSTPTDTGERRRTAVKCYRCKGLGHYARDCRAEATGNSSTSNSASSAAVQGNSRPRAPYEHTESTGHVREAAVGLSTRESYLN
jgi:hypothetical protein